jgi:hypothetical protein
VVTVGHKERECGSRGSSTRRRRGVELGRRRRKVMTGRAHLLVGHGGGRKRREVRCFPLREAAIGQGATDARSAGLAERPRPSGERGSG